MAYFGTPDGQLGHPGTLQGVDGEERRPQLVLAGSAIDHDWGVARAALIHAQNLEQAAHTSLSFGMRMGSYLAIRAEMLKARENEAVACDAWLLAGGVERRHPELSNLPDGAIDPTGEGEA